MIKVGIVDDDKIVIDSVTEFVNLQPNMKMTHAFRNAEDFLAKIISKSFIPPEILLLDVGLPGVSGSAAIPAILKLLPELDIIMLTTYEEEEVIVDAIHNGACSYISKRAGLKSIVDAINIVSMGGSYMSPAVARVIVNHLSAKKTKNRIHDLPKRQHEILVSLVDGKSYAEVATEMGISVETVRSHIKKMYRKLRIRDKTEAVAMYIKGEIN